MNYLPCYLYKKTEDGTDPETWERVDAIRRRVSISPTSDAEAINAANRLRISRNVTHTAHADYDEEYRSQRLLKVDDANDDNERYYLIESVQEVGRQHRGSPHRARVRLRLSRYNWNEDLT